MTTAAQWRQALQDGAYHGDTLATEGFIHCSTPRQVIRVANSLFKGKNGLVLLVIDPERLETEVRFENLEGGAELFPHVYGPLCADAVVKVLDFEADGAGVFQLPAELEVLASMGSVA